MDFFTKLKYFLIGVLTVLIFNSYMSIYHRLDRIENFLSQASRQ